MGHLQLRLLSAEFTLANRKYIGSKQRLLPFIETTIMNLAGAFDTFIELFAGTGVVAYRFAELGRTVIANDNLYSNYVGLNTFLTYHPEKASTEEIEERIEYLNALGATAGYCFRHFGGTYFSPDNAGRIDSIREQIHRWSRGGETPTYMTEVLLTALLYAMDKVANTCGQYDAFLKHLGKEPYDQNGVHLVDACAYKPLTLLVPALRPVDRRNQVFCADANQLIATLKADVLYLDPPYNSRQYIDNYHVLENVSRWHQPSLSGVTKKFERRHLRSAYSGRKTAGAALKALLTSAQVKHIFMSYNSEGILSADAICSILRTRGEVSVHEEAYAVFGNGAGRSVKRQVRERLFHCRCR